MRLRFYRFGLALGIIARDFFSIIYIFLYATRN